MEYEQVKEWLDDLVRRHKEANEKSYLSGSICASLLAGNVLVYKEIEVVAGIMGLELVEEAEAAEAEGSNLKYRYSFEYEGVTFVNYRAERLEAYVHM